MAAESNMRFHHGGTLDSALSRHAISFQAGAINSIADVIQIGNYYGVNNTAGMMFSGNSSIINNSQVITQATNSSGSLLLDPVPGLKHDTGLAVEWSAEEQYKLEEGLIKYANEPSIMKYIKIAALLRDKTVRDVALRCRWMTRKRRKQEDHNLGKKVKDKKDKLEASSKTNISSASPLNIAAYSLMMNNREQIEHMPVEALRGKTRHLLEENSQVLGQISANLSRLEFASVKQLQGNLDLFFRSKKNIDAILNDMRDMPGIMSRMPQLPISLNEELMNSILSSTSQGAMFGSSGVIPLKPEPGC